MNPRDAILSAVRRNLPRPAVPLPEVSSFSGVSEPLLPYFQRQVEAMGGRCFEAPDGAAARIKIAELFPAAKVICSAAPETPGTRSVEDINDPHELNDVDVGVVRSPLGVAEAGAVWLTQAELVVNALAVLSQHLVVLLDPAAVVETMHDAYGRIYFTASPYGVFLAGPSATADIEGVIIHGAQGARSLTVLLLAPTGEEAQGY
jgi:L-lactate dehydrogenase complex protein LldG